MMAKANQGGQSQPPVVKISLLEARKWALQELVAAGADQEQAADDVDFLLSGALEVNYGMLRANLTRTMPAFLAQRWPTWVARLIKQEPPQYILGTAPFYGREFFVDQRVLIPRPETELLVEWVLKDLADRPGARSVLDMGTGSGVIITTLVLEATDLVATASDISADALAVAASNLRHFHQNRVELVQSDAWQQFDAHQRFDIVVANPPYIDHDQLDAVDSRVDLAEPASALYAKEGGLAVYRAIAAGLDQHLTAAGQAYFEIGYDQGQTVKAIFEAALPTATVTVKQDLAGWNRMIKVSKHGNETV